MLVEPSLSPCAQTFDVQRINFYPPSAGQLHQSPSTNANFDTGQRANISVPRRREDIASVTLMRLLTLAHQLPAASPAHQKGEGLQNAECPPWRCSKGPSKGAEDQTQMRCSVPRQWPTERPGRELELSFSSQSPWIISDPCSSPNLTNLIVRDFCQNQQGQP